MDSPLTFFEFFPKTNTILETQAKIKKKKKNVTKYLKN
jgi:hypothetical protein